MTILTKPSFVAKAPEENQNTAENGAILDQVSVIRILLILLSIGIMSKWHHWFEACETHERVPSNKKTVNMEK